MQHPSAFAFTLSGSDTGWPLALAVRSEMLLRFAVALLLLSGFGEVMGADESQPARLWLQNTAEIQHCLVSAGEVGCGVFECFENNSCEIRGLQEICMTFLHNAGKLDAQGKSFIKDALRCMAHGLKHKVSCISRKCLAIKEMIFQLQRECYRKHNLCSAAEDNVRVMVEMIQFQNLFPKGPYVELVNILLSCSEEVKEAIIRSVHSQCEQNWGALCDSLSFCSSVTVAPASGSSRGPERRLAGSSHSEGQHLKNFRQGDKDKTNKNGFSSHARSRSQSPRRASLDAGTAEHKDSKVTDIQR